MHIVIRAGAAGVEFFSLEANSPEEAQRVFDRLKDLISSPCGTDQEQKDAALLQACRQLYNPSVGLQNKIQAIKLVREKTGWGLKEAKDWVEAKIPAARVGDPQGFSPYR